MGSREGDAAETAETVARRSYGKLIAFLAARTRNVAAAEDALSEAFASALSDWPRTGPPDNPEAWLMTVARRKLIDASRRRKTGEIAAPQLQLIAEELGAVETADIPDQRLALMFACAHPSIEESVRAPLILQVVLGLSAEVIASSFLASPAAMSKRLVRAKEKIRQAGIPFEVPARDDLPTRLSAVLDAIYTAFSEGWTDPLGADAQRRDLTGESLFLARLTVELMPEEPEALGLAALMFHAEARRAARRDDNGDFVPLAQQDTGRWSAPLMAEADDLIRRAGDKGSLGRYELEAALQSAHAHRRITGRSNWPEIVALYDALQLLIASPVVAINRALAIAEIEGPGAALDAMPDASADPRLADYQPYWAAKAELLSRWGAAAEASQAYDMAIGLERDPAVRRFLLRRKAMAGKPPVTH
jgi:RNA polymerase sigma-70 factor (ECF subfamily)